VLAHQKRARFSDNSPSTVARSHRCDRVFACFAVCSLDENKIGDVGAKALAKALEVNACALTELT
jgi:hypothetical protein